MYTHKFKVFANIVYPVQIIASQRKSLLDDFSQNKKNKRTCNNEIINRTPVIVLTYYFGHISHYLCIFLLCSVSIFPRYLAEIHEMAVWSEDLPSLLMAMFNDLT